MNATLQQMIARGLEPIITESKDVIGEARIKHGHNDVMIFALVEEDGLVDLRSAPRPEALATMQEKFPDASHALKILTQPLLPDQFVLIVFDISGDDMAVFSLILRIKGTQGVLN